jgi:cytochrome c-type biogenesis protein CcmH/NrfG
VFGASPEWKFMEMKTLSGARWSRPALIGVALVYALLAGLHTVSETDLGWQMATGRYIVQHHQIPATTLYTYTVPGSTWIYPPFSGVIFYLLYVIGGYAAISWFSALACAATVAIAVWGGGRVTAALAILAVPAIAFRTVPRADLFTTVLFAAVLVLLVRHYEGHSVRLWLLPILMMCWVNLHHGFVAGLALIGAYGFTEVCDLLFADRRVGAFARLRKALPWLFASAAATLVNPWGFGIYRALSRQNKLTQPLTDFIGEWSSVHFNALALRQALRPRDPASADWWIMAIAVLAVLVCVWRMRFGPTMLIVGLLYQSIEHIRFQAVFAVLVVVLGGSLLPQLAEVFSKRRSSVPDGLESPQLSVRSSSSQVFAWSLVVLFVVFAGVRSYDLVSNRYYIDSGQLHFFGAGESWWFPERAMDFLEKEHLPANLFHSYTMGGFLTWRVGERYPDFADGRFVPFAGTLFSEQNELSAAPPDSALWQKAADRWNINSIIFSLSRYAGLGSFPLSDYCQSKNWKPVYIDDVAIVVVRNRPESVELLPRAPVRCDTVHLTPPATASGNSFRARAERFNFLMNSASIYYLLSRDQDALAALQEAAPLFPDNSNLHLVTAQLLHFNNHFAEAEQEYLRAIRAQPGDAAWFALARLYNTQHRYPEAVRCVKEAVAYSQVPYERYRSLGHVYLTMKQPQDALVAYERAERSSPYRSDTTDLGKAFNAHLAEDRARAYRDLADLPNAIAQQELAVRFTPEDSAAWLTMSELYEAQGNSAGAAAARQRAVALQSPVADAPAVAEPQR